VYENTYIGVPQLLHEGYLRAVRHVTLTVFTSLYSIKRALYSIKRALYSIKKALSSIKRALYSRGF
jgi:hypothetical protein